ncbi:hypothetical protein L227DRAFT_617671 [Lentinus tigrinus ALCF2SS1-6]|uniref:Uncharacterized protein n=1 Tax=Lentinus tigrinus ALCF2SS1-6 TaxID=1328759 RepID=A0A5C2RLW2_9APHY|nr:hypothetical protein L227DRAFT_617671 [Lentinus tigrinus ALCF2SS1-6]
MTTANIRRVTTHLLEASNPGTSNVLHPKGTDELWPFNEIRTRSYLSVEKWHLSSLLYDLPNPRTQAFEADNIGLRLSARACLDPAAVSDLWVDDISTCYSLVELIVLNIGLSAGIYNTHTFSMFVLHALVLTFRTMPLTFDFYPPKCCVRRIVGDALKSCFTVIIDRIDQLPAVMNLTQLPQGPSADTTLHKCMVYQCCPTLCSSLSSVVRSDPVLAILKTYGFLNVSTSLAVIGHKDFLGNVEQHACASSSQIVILPWTSGLALVEMPHSPIASEQSPSGPSITPFDALFQQKRERDHSSVAVDSHLTRRVFAGVPADIALFWEHCLPQASDSGTEYHVFMPFLGGPGDRTALSFVVQLMNSIDVVKVQNLLHSTVHSCHYDDDDSRPDT